MTQFIVLLCTTTEGRAMLDALCTVVDNDTAFQEITETFIQTIHESSSNNTSHSSADSNTAGENNENTSNDSTNNSLVKSGPGYGSECKKGAMKALPMGILKAWTKIPAEQKANIVNKSLQLTVKYFGEGHFLAIRVPQIVGFLQKPYIPVAIVVVCLAVEIIWDIAQWYRGRISGKTLLKNIAVTITTSAAGFCGGLGGAALGTAICPGPGTLIGGIVGGMAAGSASRSLLTWLGEIFFDLPPSFAVKNAYEFMLLNPSCTNEQINARYEYMRTMIDPANGSTDAQKKKLDYAVQIIKQERGQGPT